MAKTITCQRGSRIKIKSSRIEGGFFPWGVTLKLGDYSIIGRGSSKKEAGKNVKEVLQKVYCETHCENGSCILKQNRRESI